MNSTAFSTTGLARLHDVMTSYVERGEVPGVVAVLSRGGEVQVEVMGSLSFGGPALQRDSLFRISSMTKPVTAVAALMLVEECRLRLDDAVDELLPELADRRVLQWVDGPLDDTVPAKRPMTLRDLLTFRMGFGQIMANPEQCPILQASGALQLGMGPPNPQKMPAPDEWLRRLGTLPLMYQPGERWLYNTGSDVLGILIARASGKPFETFLRERVFMPLGMKDTAFQVAAGQMGRFATSYWTNRATGAMEVYDPAEGGQWSLPPVFALGGAGLVSTADDYLAFSQMLMNQGKYGTERILSRASVEVMTTDQLTAEQKSLSGFLPGHFDNCGWGFGVNVVTKRSDLGGAVGQFGWDGGLGTSWRSDPKENLTGIVLTQRAWTAPRQPAVCRDFWTLAYRALGD
jgi:CubicO group peptidase (beta-lactamase class C family)